MKLANTFLTCTGNKGMQWQHTIKGNVVKQLTYWRDGNGVLRNTVFGAVSDEDKQRALNKFMAS